MNLNFDLDKFVQYVLPSFMRKDVMKGYLKVLLTAIKDLFDDAQTFNTKTISELQTSIATNVLQAKLRVLYPDVGSYKVFVKTQWVNLPQEYIQFNGEHHKQLYAYKMSEATLTGYMFKRSERVLPYDYYVILPTTYATSLASIDYLVNKFRPAGKRYLIQFSNINS